ncbi:hypothetical protein AXF42_Ash019494 [Apostasia shenzhenica]|uniref:Uncharacterized protein n=1 Tax=Apostasia shenzhenica TaxID=1088818 RepID=A0A2I0AYI0_9ASPA|nr:hypothetical protein AXF42_Ash019494 [Apostasia shenzhenica]
MPVINNLHQPHHFQSSTIPFGVQTEDSRAIAGANPQWNHAIKKDKALRPLLPDLPVADSKGTVKMGPALFFRRNLE